jgi:hypothetical protein
MMRMNQNGIEFVCEVGLVGVSVKELLVDSVNNGIQFAHSLNLDFVGRVKGNARSH